MPARRQNRPRSGTHLTSAQALQPLAQLRQKSPKAGIVRGSHQTGRRQFMGSRFRDAVTAEVRRDIAELHWQIAALRVLLQLALGCSG